MTPTHNNPNQVYAISRKGRENIGNIRETFFANMLSVDHKITASRHGDFFVDNRYTFEIGGKNKRFKQIKDVSDFCLAIDDTETGINRKSHYGCSGFCIKEENQRCQTYRFAPLTAGNSVKH